MGHLTRTPVVLAVLGALATGTACSGQEPADPVDEPASTSPEVSPDVSPDVSLAPSPPAPEPERAERAERRRQVRISDVDPAVAARAVQHLAGTIGPRHGTSPAYRRAADWVAGRLEDSGLEVRRQQFPVPAGVSWGVPVAAGRSVNLVAAPPGLDTREPHLVVGAHLDTVPQAPGAEDNASGVGALLAVAHALQGRRTRLPVVLVAFGAEEPRGPTDDDHHYGSRAYVARLSLEERDALRGMLSLDRVGVGTRMPVCSATDPPGPLRAELLVAARRAGAAPLPCSGNRSSDHWSFVRDGLPGVRLGSTPYAGYHSAGDVPAVVRTEQLARAARTTVAWVRGP